MLIGIFHRGSGLGNQLFRYVMTRVLALDKGFDFGMACPENFKGKDFMNLDMGLPIYFSTHTEEPSGKVVVESDWRLFQENYQNGYDWEGINSIRDNTIIDGEFQGEKYFKHHLKEIEEWLNVESLDKSYDLCVINFRGGEYTFIPDLFLTKGYWKKGIEMMKKINPKIKFEVHTDDWKTAKEFFPEYDVYRGIGLNWRSIRYAKYLLLSNSSFAILPTLLNEDKKKVIAPKFWGRRNKGFWSLPYNKYNGWTYI